MKFQPSNDRILVRREEQPSESIIRVVSHGKPTTGRVVAVGPGRTLETGLIQPTGVKEGDLILFAEYQGMDVSLAGEPFVILRSDDVLGILS
jgi:chaperonin GroES